MFTTNKNPRYFLVSSLALFSLVPGIAQAQDAPEQDITEEDTIVFDDVVVTARKVEENVQDVPISLTVLSEQTFERAGLNDFADIAQLTPNFDIKPNPVAGSQFAVSTIRGQTNNFFSLNVDQAIAVSINGAPITRGTSLFSSLFDVERIEVLKGPQGTLFGKNSTGGAVNVITRGPVIDEFEGYAQATIGNYDRNDFEAVVNVPLVEDFLAVRLGAQVNNRDGFGQTDPTLAGANFDLADDDEFTLRASALFKASDSLSVRINADYKEVDEAPVIQRGLEDVTIQFELFPGFFIPVPLAAASLSSDPFNGDFWAGAGRDIREPFARSEELNVNATTTLDIGDMTLTAISSYREQESLSELQNAISTSIFQGQESELFAQEVRLNGISSDGQLVWQAGAFYSDEEGYDVDVLPEAGVFQVFQAENETLAIFGQGSYDLTDAVTVTLGARYTTEDRILRDAGPTILDAAGLPVVALGSGPLFEGDTEFDAVSWLASVDYKPTDDVLLYASVARGFRSGGLDQDNLGQIFEPEYILSYETGFKADLFSDRVRFNGAAFYSDYSDIQVVRNVPLPGGAAGVTTVLDNAAEAKLWGFELDLTAQPIEGLTLGGTVGYTKGEYDEFTAAAPGGGIIDRSDEPIGGLEWTYTLNGRYETQLSSDILIGAQANYFWVDGVPLAADAIISTLASGGTVDSYGLLNAQIDVEFESFGEGLNVALFANNATDELYFPAGFVVPFGPFGTVDNRITGDPRTYGIRATQRF